MREIQEGKDGYSGLDLVVAPRGKAHTMPFGAECLAGDGVRFRLWAPAEAAVRVVVDATEPLHMHAVGGGWHALTVEWARAGMRYEFELGDGQRVADPASRFQPDGVKGTSEVIDPAAYVWRETAWRGRSWAEAVLYELHVGSFTPEGTFRAAIDKLDHLVELGVTAIELMPVASFEGRWSWGYDGVLLFAPDMTYGRPEELKALVDAAHTRGLMVLLDVVYNHFGPVGNYMAKYAPQIFTDRHETSWGSAVNFDGDGSDVVREFVVHNALYWIHEYNLDGLRLDAVHAIVDDSSRHVADELAERVRKSDGMRPIHLLLENEKNEPTHLLRDAAGAPGRFTAQWNDDVHHALHVAATAESHSYYEPFALDTNKLGHALAKAPAAAEQDGEESVAARSGLPAGAYVAFIQNHDQVGNRPRGERISVLAPVAAQKAIAAVYLLLPQTPMLFMGEEWGTKRPFAYFCDFHGDLAESIRCGRREEFPETFEQGGVKTEIPNPTEQSTYLSAKLDWEAAGKGDHAALLEWYRQVLSVRREKIVPVRQRIKADSGEYRVLGRNALVVEWSLGDGGRLQLAANLSDSSVDEFPEAVGEVFWHEGPPPLRQSLRPWSARWSMEKAPRHE